MDRFDNENEDFNIGFRPTSYYNTNSLIARMINQGSTLKKDELLKAINDLKNTVKSILIEGGMISIDDFITLAPCISLLEDEDAANMEKIGLKIKATIPFSLSESVAMEFKPKESMDVDGNI